MSWVLFSQILALMVVGTILTTMVHSIAVDKRREDDYKRKQGGL